MMEPFLTLVAIVVVVLVPAFAIYAVVERARMHRQFIRSLDDREKRLLGFSVAPTDSHGNPSPANPEVVFKSRFRTKKRRKKRLYRWM